MKLHEEMVADWKKKPDFQQEYDALEAEFLLFDELLNARKEVGLTQVDVVDCLEIRLVRD